MTNVAIVYHSGFGHTKALAEAVAKGAELVRGSKVSLIPVAEAEAREAEQQPKRFSKRPAHDGIPSLKTVCD